MKIRHTLFALLAVVFLAGCSSRDAMDYLPEMPAYIAFNPEQARSSAGGKRLLEAAQKMQPEAAELLEGKMKRLYVGVEPQARSAGGCAVAIGEPGFAKFAEEQFRRRGAKEQTMSGRKVLTSGTISSLSIGDNGVLIFSRAAELEKMIRTSQKKSPSARQSVTFQTAESLSGSHTFAMVADWTQVLSALGGQIEQVSLLSPKGAEALKQVRSASLTFDYNEQPVAEATLHLPAPEGREDLAGLVNGALSMVTRMKPKNIDPGLTGMLNNLKAESSDSGVTIKVSVPEEAANAWFEKMEQRQASSSR